MEIVHLYLYSINKFQIIFTMRSLLKALSKYYLSINQDSPKVKKIILIILLAVVPSLIFADNIRGELYSFNPQTGQYMQIPNAVISFYLDTEKIGWLNTLDDDSFYISNIPEGQYRFTIKFKLDGVLYMVDSV